MNLLSSSANLRSECETAIDLSVIIGLPAAFELPVIVNRIDCPDLNVVNVMFDIIEFACPVDLSVASGLLGPIDLHAD